MGLPLPRRIFISYAHADNESADPDQRWLDRLVEMVAPLQMTNEIGLWTDRDIKAGAKWNSQLEEVITTADVAVLLVSPAYLASRFIRESELPTLLYRAQKAHRNVDILPVILRYCLYEESTFTYSANDNPSATVSLSVFQSVNSPEDPLESLPRSSQDLILRTLARRMYAAFKAKAPIDRSR